MEGATIHLASRGKLTEAGARALIEETRWLNGPVCAQRGVVDDAGRITSTADTEDKVRDGLDRRSARQEPFTVTVGTVMESSPIPLSSGCSRSPARGQ